MKIISKKIKDNFSPFFYKHILKHLFSHTKKSGEHKKDQKQIQRVSIPLQRSRKLEKGETLVIIVEQHYGSR